ncbi:electron transport complex subunit RsxC [bacterium]|nr:electron transport complex subunit RsxC [bacterium]
MNIIATALLDLVDLIAGSVRSRAFSGGVHPEDCKHYTEHKIIEQCPLPDYVIIPLQQHIGAPSECLVEKGMSVKTGQPLSKSTQFVSVPVHASISGRIAAIEKRPHPGGNQSLSIVIENDGKDEWFDPAPDTPIDTDNIDIDDLKQRIQDAGIAGMGGASFPTHVKLSPPSDKPIDVIILNGVECEPYLTADHRLMLEKTDEILKGLHILMRIVRAKKAIIGIEKNKADAIQLMQKKTKRWKKISVLPLPVKYPQGGEKQLIRAALKRQVPAGGLPMDIGCIVQNVATALAVYEAVAFRKPLIERIVTVTGPGITEPKNFRARIGTPFHHLITASGGYTTSDVKIIHGGPMMGITELSDQVPVIKGTSGILVLDQSVSDLSREQPCISCARCVDVCPMKLMPNRIASFVEHDRIDEAVAYGLSHCIECGSCSYICPAKRHLVHYIKHGKALLVRKRNSS